MLVLNAYIKNYMEIFTSHYRGVLWIYSEKDNRALYYIFRIHSPVMVSIWPFFFNICTNKVYTIICDLFIWKPSLLQHSNIHALYSVYIIGTIICDLVILKPSLLQHNNSRHVIIYSIYTNLLIELNVTLCEYI